jgi:hypothetical protein
MCHVSHATSIYCRSDRSDTAKELQDDPESDDDQRGHLYHLCALQYSDLSLWEQYNVSA